MFDQFRKKFQFHEEHPSNVARERVAIPQAALARALPFAVEPVLRFRLHALVTSADIAGAAYNQLVELAIRSEWEDHKEKSARTTNLNSSLFQQVWSLVDQVHSIRLLIRSLGLEGPTIAAFMAATEKARVLRNRMDHLSQNIPNISASKKPSRSLFGSLSYFVSATMVGMDECDVVMVHMNAEPVLPDENYVGPAPHDYRMPIGNFVISAGGEMLDLDLTILTLGPVMTGLSKETEEKIRLQLPAMASKTGVQEDDLLSQLGTHLKVKLFIKFDEPPH